MKKDNKVNSSKMEEKNIEIEEEKLEQRERGERIKYIREKELKMKKTQLGKEIGISGQFLGLVEEGKGNLVYKSVKKLRDLSGHSADYILFGLDDNAIKETRKALQKYSEKEIVQALEIIQGIINLIKNK